MENNCSLCIANERSNNISIAIAELVIGDPLRKPRTSLDIDLSKFTEPKASDRVGAYRWNCRITN